MNHNYICWCAFFFVMVSCSKNSSNRELARLDNDGRNLVPSVAEHNSMVYFSASQVHFDGLLKKKIVKVHKVRTSVGKGASNLFDRNLATGWQATYSEREKPWIDLYLKAAPYEVFEIHILPGCPQDKKRFIGGAKLDVSWFGQLDSSRLPKTAKGNEDDDHYLSKINEKNEVILANNYKDDLPWIISDLNAPDYGDDAVSTRIRITVVSLNESRDKLVCIGEVVVLANPPNRNDE